MVFVPGENKIVEDSKHKMLISPEIDKLIFIDLPNTPICRIYLAPCRVNVESPTTCVLTHYFHHKDKEKAHEIVVAKITSTEPCIKHIQSLCQNRKYKSCLSFQPSAVRHISILSGESPTQKYRGFINLVLIMFVVLNLRNIVDNFFRYGARFTNAPLEFVPLSALIGFSSLMFFVELAYRLDRLRFHKRLSDLVVVLHNIYREFF